MKMNKNDYKDQLGDLLAKNSSLQEENHAC